MAIHILFLDKWFDFVGGNCGEAGGRPFNEPCFDRSQGEGGGLLCCLYWLVSSFSFSLSLEKMRRCSNFYPSDDPLTFSVSSPLPLPQVLKTNLFKFIVRNLIFSFFSNNFLQWYSIYRPYEPQAWLLLLAVMLFMGGSLNLWHRIFSDFVLQVLSWVWSESVAEKRSNDKVSSSTIPSLTPSKSILASASAQSMIQIWRSSSYYWSTDS